jgi:hypothetical protein
MGANSPTHSNSHLKKSGGIEWEVSPHHPSIKERRDWSFDYFWKYVNHRDFLSKKHGI